VKQKLEPAFPDQPIKPATFPDSKGEAEYLIYERKDGTKDVVIDTTQSQANRIEPLFFRSGMVPDHTVLVNGESVPLVDIGHRIADFVVRYSDAAEDVKTAITALQANNPEPLARLAPTSLLFGFWDSRDPNEVRTRSPRLIQSTIIAHDVTSVPNAGAYKKSVERFDDLTNEQLSAEGMNDCLFSGLGGVIVEGEIIRTAQLNVRAIRSFKPEVQQYLLGLGLFAITGPASLNLRDGCNLVATSTVVEVMNEDGTRSTLSVTYEDAKAFGQQVATTFGVAPARQFVYDEKRAKSGVLARDAKKVEKKARKSDKAKKGEAATAAA